MDRNERGVTGLLGLVIAATVATTGCSLRPDAGTKEEQCEALMERLDEEDERISSASGANAKALKKTAKALDKGAKRIRKVKLADRELKKQRRRFCDGMEEIADASRKVAEALEDGDPGEAASQAKEMSAIAKRASKAQNAMKRACGEKDGARLSDSL